MLVTIFFTQNSGLPATSLALADIALYLTAIAKTDGAATVIWDGTQHPSAEIGSLGLYLRQYSGEDTVLYDYVAGAQYTGATELDADWTTGVLNEPVKTDAAGRVEVSGSKNTLDALSGSDADTLKTLSDQLDLISSAAGAGSETVTLECLNASSAPLEGVAVWVTSDLAGATVRAGTLYSNSSGLVTVYLDPGSYFVWRQGGANWSNPQLITVTDV